jgi:hypothetical protein
MTDEVSPETVEKLRAQGYAQGQDHERDRVVAFIRAIQSSDGTMMNIDVLVNLLEAGEHRRLAGKQD